MQFQTFASDRDYPGLSGGFRKKFRKLSKAAAHVGAAVFTGGASLAVSAALLNAERQKKAQAAAARQEQALMAQITSPPSIAPSMQFSPSVERAVVPSSGAMPSYPAVYSASAAPSASFIQRDETPAASFLPVSEGGSPKPAWLMPALLVGGGLIAVMMFRGGGQK